MMTLEGESVSRRRFFKTAAQAGAVAMAPMIVPSSVLGQRAGAVAPSDRIVTAGLGIGSRGGSDLRALLSYREVQFVAICDVRNNRREEVKSMVDQRYQNRDCAMYDDQFELLARQDIDALLIATGDRWHTPLSILAAEHGKDVYCEKPCSMSIAESRALADAFRRYGRVYQAGCQRRNGGNLELAIEMVYTGKLGKLHTVVANVGPSVNWPPLPSHDWLAGEPEPPKQVLDWDRWLGPAPWRPYHPSYVSGGWRNWYDFHGGGILEWGSHTVDLCHWAAKLDDTQPVEYVPEGTNTGPYAVHCRFANGLKLRWWTRVERPPEPGLLHHPLRRRQRLGGDGRHRQGGDFREPPVRDPAHHRGQARPGIPHGGLAGLHQVQETAEGQRRRGSQFPHHLPCGLHRLPVGPQVDVGPGEG
jgi:hypothetical protein